MSSSRALSRSSAASSTSSEAAMGAAGEDDGVSTDSTLVASSSEKENAKITFAGVPAAMKEDQPTALRPKRSTLFYASPGFNTKSNQKPFAGSAAKRESVQALGTIAHLQEFYTRQGLAARQSPLANRQLQPALGPAALAQADENDVLAAKLAQLRAGDNDETTPPVDALAALEGRAPRDVPTAEHRLVTESTWKGKAYPDVAKPVEADLKKLRQTMMVALDETCWQWDLHGEAGGGSAAAAAAAAQPLDITAPRAVDVLELINATTQAIRAVRNYLFALPPMAPAADTQQQGAAVGNERSASGSLRRKPSATFKGQHGSVKAKDAFKRQSSFSGLPRPSVTGLPMQHFASTTGAANGRGQVPASGAPQQLPFQTVKRLNVSSRVDSSRTATPTSPASSGPPPSSYRAAGIERRVASELLQRRSSIEEEQPALTAAAPRDPLVVVRASALEVLGMLRDLEEQNRVAVAPSARGTSAGRLPPSSSKASVRMLRGDYSESSFGVNGEQHDDDEEDGEDDVAYRSDLTLANLGEPRSLVRGYLATVNTVMSELRPQRGGGGGGAKQVANGLVGAAQPLSPRLAVLGLPATEDDLPPWARATLDEQPSTHLKSSTNAATAWLPRLRLLIDDLLPNEAATSLGFSPTASPSATLHRLANGLLLCHAFNAALRTSARPWGFIDEGTVHDDVDEEDDGGEKGAGEASDEQQQEEENGQGAKKASTKSKVTAGRWTFRRVENLRRFAAAVQLRYGSSGSSGCSVTPAVRAFDAVRVARRGEEDETDTRWQTQLEGLVAAWLGAVVREVREASVEEEGVGG